MTDRSLHVESNLSFSVTGPAGPVTGRLEGSGSTMTVRTSDPVATLDAALGGQPYTSSAVEALAARLSASGITVDVVGPRGTVVTLGAGVISSIGRVLAGSRRVRLGSIRATAPLIRARFAPATQRLPSSVGWLVWPAAAALVLWISERRALPRPARSGTCTQAAKHRKAT